MKYYAYHFSYSDMEIGTSISPKVYGDFRGMKSLMEESLEKVRTKEYSNYNTRLNCVFLAPTKESALEWCRDINILHWRNERLEVSFFLYFVEISEQPIWFDSDILVGFYIPNTNKDSISKAYWDSGIIDIDPNTTRALEYMTVKETVIIGKIKWKIKTDGEVVQER